MIFHCEAVISSYFSFDCLIKMLNQKNSNGEKISSEFKLKNVPYFAPIQVQRHLLNTSFTLVDLTDLQYLLHKIHFYFPADIPLICFICYLTQCNINSCLRGRVTNTFTVQMLVNQRIMAKLI